MAAYQRGDYATALNEFLRLAEEGNCGAQYNLGVMYRNGLGVPRVYARAVKWYRKAAEQGYAEAQNILGSMYDNGQGVPQDYAQAHMWYNLVASRLPPGKERDNAARNLENLAAKMSPAQISEAQKLAREWRPKK